VLAGCVIAVTADRRFKELAAALERRGATVEHAPALEVVPHLDDESLVESTRAILANPPDVVVATTGIGFRGWIEAADAVGLADELLDVLGAADLRQLDQRISLKAMLQPLDREDVEHYISHRLTVAGESVSVVFERAAIKRIGTPEDIVGAALFLASPAAAWITGHMLAVDGGWLAA